MIHAGAAASVLMAPPLRRETRTGPDLACRRHPGTPLTWVYLVGNRLYGPSRPNRPKLEFRRRLSVAGSRRCCATCASVGTPGTGGSGPGPSRRTLRSVVNPGEALKASTIRAAVQRRTIAVLCLAQLLSGFMNGVVLTVSPLLAVEITGSVGFAGMPMTAMAVVAALTAQPLAALAMKHGRRIALTGGLLLAALGSAGMMLAPLWRSFPVLLVGAGLVGAGMATHWQARFAATDLAIRATRARDLGLVVWAIAPGAIVGPNLVAPGSVLGASLGLPPLSGPFVFSLAGLVAAAVVLLVGLRPDPLFVAHQLEDSMAVVGPAADTPSTQSSFVVGLTAIRTSPRAVLGVAIVVSVQLLVVAIVSGTPVHLRILAELHARTRRLGCPGRDRVDDVAAPGRKLPVVACHRLVGRPGRTASGGVGQPSDCWRRPW